MTHAGLPVSGYQPQATDNVERVNRNKALEELVVRTINQHKSISKYDQRLISMAFSQFQIGFMLLNRAVFQPSGVDGSEQELYQKAFPPVEPGLVDDDIPF